MSLPNFYDGWLGLWDQAEAERKGARKAIHENELEWVETRFDARAALLIAPETGFRTWGSVCLVAEIPLRTHTGRHKHGEEAIFIIEGEGFSVISGRRYDWTKESVLLIPFGAEHQHFNTGSARVRYFSNMAVHLEHFVGLHRTVHFEDWGANGTLPDIPRSTNGLAPDGRRVLLTEPTTLPDETDFSAMPHVDADHPLVVGDMDGMDRVGLLHRPRSMMRQYMRVGKDLNGFESFEQEIESIMSEPPKQYSGKHAHMEAALYILGGEGYSIIDGERFDWRTGSAIHIAGPQTVHQHFNTADSLTHMLRMAPGIRYWFEKFAQGEFPYLFLQPRQAVVEQREGQSAKAKVPAS